MVRRISYEKTLGAPVILVLIVNCRFANPNSGKISSVRKAGPCWRSRIVMQEEAGYAYLNPID